MPAVPKPSQSEAAKPKRIRAKRATPAAVPKARKPVAAFDGEIMTIDEAATALGVKPGRVRTLLKEGTLVADTSEGVKRGVTPKSVTAYGETRGQRKSTKAAA